MFPNGDRFFLDPVNTEPTQTIEATITNFSIPNSFSDGVKRLTLRTLKVFFMPEIILSLSQTSNLD